MLFMSFSIKTNIYNVILRIFCKKIIRNGVTNSSHMHTICLESTKGSDTGFPFCWGSSLYDVSLNYIIHYFGFLVSELIILNIETKMLILKYFV